MPVYLISGNGQGAGKTYLAEKLVGPQSVYSLAGTMRQELKSLYPQYDWFNKTQEYKDNTLVKEWGKGDQTIRQVMINYGQKRCEDQGHDYWAKRLIKQLYEIVGKSVVAIDDVRKGVELEALKSAFQNCVHFHVCYNEAQEDPVNDENFLFETSDYVVSRK